MDFVFEPVGTAITTTPPSPWFTPGGSAPYRINLSLREVRCTVPCFNAELTLGAKWLIYAILP